MNIIMAIKEDDDDDNEGKRKRTFEFASGVERRLLACFSHVRVIDVNCFDRSVDGVGRRGFGTTHAVRLDGDGRRQQQR